jgi:nitroreductase
MFAIADAVIEGSWSVVMLAGMLCAFENARASFRDRLKAGSGNGFRTVLLESTFIVNLLLFLALLMFLATGVIALFEPPNEPAPTAEDRAVAVASIIALFLGGITVAVVAMLSFYYRRLLERM